MSDRLSSLQDTVLIRILYFLSIDEAAATSLLSRRWLYLWTKTTSLRISRLNFGSKKFFSALIHCAKQLSWDNFHVIQVDFPTLDEVYKTILTQLIDDICSANVKVVNLNIDSLFNYKGSIQLQSSMFFEMKSLESLELSYRFVLTLPKNGVRLPCMKKLVIYVKHTEFQLLSDLVSSCPSLEYLKVNVSLQNRQSKKYRIGICSSSLRRLSIQVNEDYSYYDNTTTLRILSDAPKLEDIAFDGCVDFSIGLLKNWSDLV